MLGASGMMVLTLSHPVFAGEWLEVDGEGRLVQLKPAFGGAIEAPIYSKTLPNMATVRPGVFERFEPSASRVPGKITLDPVIPGETRVRHVELWPTDARDTTGLETAWSVICVGNGVGGAELHYLGDSGWLAVGDDSQGF